MGQPGHVNASRLGTSNFWNFNSFDHDNRNFINNFFIKKMMKYFYHYSVKEFRDVFFNKKWSKKLIHKNVPVMYYYRQVVISVHWAPATIVYDRRVPRYKYYSSKIQILRYKSWFILFWFLYTTVYKRKSFRNYLTSVDGRFKPINNSHLKLVTIKSKIYKVLLYRLYIHYKLYNFKKYQLTDNSNFTFNFD